MNLKEKRTNTNDKYTKEQWRFLIIGILVASIIFGILCAGYAEKLGLFIDSKYVVEITHQNGDAELYFTDQVDSIKNGCSFYDKRTKRQILSINNVSVTVTERKGNK